jgi:hypothetical protein
VAFSLRVVAAAVRTRVKKNCLIDSPIRHTANKTKPNNHRTAIEKPNRQAIPPKERPRVNPNRVENTHRRKKASTDAPVPGIGRARA